MDYFQFARLIFVAVCSRKKVKIIQMKSVEWHMMKMFVKDRTFP